MTKEINLRPLKAADAKRLAKLLAEELDMLSDLAPAAQDGSPVDAEQRRKTGARMVQTLIGKHADTLWEWLADLAGMTAEELDESPLDTPLRIAKALSESEDMTSFLDYAKSFVPPAEPGDPEG